MTYKIQEILPEPVVQGLTLEINGEAIATARRRNGNNDWLLVLPPSRPSKLKDIFVDLSSESHARRVLDWIGSHVSPSLAVINGPEDLHLATPDVTYRTDYNGGNQYQVNSEGSWYYNTLHGIAHGYPFSECPGRRPYSEAYPLVEMR